jgi:hypothetical protein
MKEEATGRINAENEAFYANSQTLQCELLSERSELGLYRSAMRPVVTQACEAWVLKGNMAQKLMRLGSKS